MKELERINFNNNNPPALSEQILKQLQDNTENCINKKNIITAVADRQDISVSANWGNTIIKLTGDTTIGDRIVREGSKVRITDNISKVKISATSHFLNKGNSGDKNFSIYKNGNPVYGTYTSGLPSGTSLYENHSLSPIIMAVKPNDYFELRIVSGGITTITLLNANITIEEIE